MITSLSDFIIVDAFEKVKNDMGLYENPAINGYRHTNR